MREQTCCITGQHLRREEDEEALKARLRRTIEGLAAQNVTHFVMGGAPGFELLAGEVVLEKRAEDPRIRLTVMLPHADVSKGWKRCDVERHERLLAQADEMVYTSYRKEAGCVQQRNRWLVSSSSVCLCYLTRKVGGVWYTVLLSIRRGLSIINLSAGETEADTQGGQAGPQG